MAAPRGRRGRPSRHPTAHVRPGIQHPDPHTLTHLGLEREGGVLVKDSAGSSFALGDMCSHADISLSEGFVEGDALECWAHGGRFDLSTGRARTLPASEPVPVYQLTTVDGDVSVDVSNQVDVSAHVASTEGLLDPGSAQAGCGSPGLGSGWVRLAWTRISQRRSPTHRSSSSAAPQCTGEAARMVSSGWRRRRGRATARGPS
ncbi:hypothetical protein E3T23_10335 [Cryobacterium cheniae]|uniref:Rieske domain-containing protein n=1 Tax=Cryobacterium cheniae TaxID=1259262 RepID=A0A4R8XLV3_9MICO|nr:hypothetical protein E3T23_10335 [Cryobacterium cheniae]